MTQKKPQSQSPTWYVVCGVLGLGLMATAYILAGWKWGLFLAGLLAYEGWTLVNNYKHDTISEIIWELAHRPLVPFIFGAAFVSLICNGIIPVTIEGVYMSGCIGFLMGHFFFQRKSK